MGADDTDTAEPDRGGKLDGNEKRLSHRQCGVQKQQETSAGATSVASWDAHRLQGSPQETVYSSMKLLYGADKINNGSYRNSLEENTHLGLILTSGNILFRP